jgi:hypothetical protein
MAQPSKYFVAPGFDCPQAQPSFSAISPDPAFPYESLNTQTPSPHHLYPSPSQQLKPVSSQPIPNSAAANSGSGPRSSRALTEAG